MILPAHLKRLTLPVLLSVALAGCGGGSSFDTSSTETTETTETETTAAQAEIVSLEISASSTVLLSKGSNEVTVYAVAKDKNNNVLPDAEVVFAVDSNATIIASSDNAGANTKSATLSSGMNHPESRTLTVTVTSGTLTQTLTVEVDDTPVVTGAGDTTVASLDISASASDIYSLGSNEVTLSVIAKNADNNIIEDVPVSFRVDNDGVVSPTAGNDTADIKTASLSSGLGHPEARTLTVTVTAGTIVKTITVNVVEDDDPVEDPVSPVASLEISASSGVLLSNGSNEVTIYAVAKDNNNNILTGEDVTFAVDSNATIVPGANSGNQTKTATLSSGMNHPESRMLTVTVTAGSITKTLTVQVDDTEIATGGSDTTVTALDVTASASELYSLGSNEVIISVVAKNAANNVLKDTSVTFSVDNDALISPSSSNDSADVKTATLTSGLGHPEARALIVTVTAGALVKTIAVNVVESTDPVVEPESKVTQLEISASSRQLFSDGLNPVVISAIAKDINNNILSDAVVTFSVNNDATIAPDAGNASATVKTADLTPGLNHPENRTLDVEVMAGSITKHLQVDVVGTTVSVNGPDSIAINTPTNYTLKLEDSSGKALAFHDVAVSSSAGSTITPEDSFVTNAVGEMNFSVTASADGEDTITVTGLGASATKVVGISGNDFSLSSDEGEIILGTPETVTIKWTKDGFNQANETIQLSATRGVLTPSTSVITDANGEATFTIQSDTAGGTVITATTDNGLSTNLEREFVSTTPAYLNTQASPQVVGPHGVSTLTSKVRDLNDNPVKNQHVVFNLEDRVNGMLSNSLAVTDSLGRATVTYTASDIASAKDGVIIQTYVQENPTIVDDVKLTVGGDALRIVLGEDENLGETGIFYSKNFGVIITDSAGNPVAGKEVAFTITPTHYYKGWMETVDIDGDGEMDIWSRNTQATCNSEDLDNDGNLDQGEDENSNNRLEPSHDATVTTTGVTDEQGKLTITVVYPQSRALWSRQLLTATVSSEGTEFVEHTEFTLPILASDVKNIEVAPPNALPPYGSANDCTNPD